jgi:hypothetical protein
MILGLNEYAESFSLLKNVEKIRAYEVSHGKPAAAIVTCLIRLIPAAV